MSRRNLIHSFIGIFLCVPLAVSSGHASEAKTPPPLDRAIAMAKEAGKPLLIEFSASWCGPCKEFNANVLPREDVQRALVENVMFVTYDTDVKPGIAAAERLGVPGVPTFVVVDAKGEMRMRRSGGMSAARFIEFVTQAPLALLGEDEMNRRLADAPDDAQLLLRGAQFFGGQGHRDKADALYGRAIAADPGNRAGVASQAAWQRMQMRRYRQVRADIAHEQAAYLSRYPGSNAAIGALSLLIHAQELPASKVRSLADRVVAATDDGDALNRLVYILLGADLHKAAVAAGKKQVALAPDQTNPYDTLAEALYAAGDQKAAIEASSKAVSLAQDADVRAALQDNLRRFSANTPQPAPDIEASRARGEMQVARLSLADPTTRPARLARPNNPFMTFYRTVNGALTAAGKTCADKAGKLPEAYVRLEFKPDTNQLARVVTLEPGAPRRLRRCLSAHFKKAEMPDRVPARINGRYTGRVSFDAAK